MIRREGTIYHIDSPPGVSGEGRYVHIISAALFAEYVTYYRQGIIRPNGPQVGGLCSVYYTGRELGEHPAAQGFQ